MPSSSAVKLGRVRAAGVRTGGTGERITEVDMNDPFVGTWTLSATGSAFDPNHKPAQAGTVHIICRWDSDGDSRWTWVSPLM